MILASDIIKTILVERYKETSCMLWDFKSYPEAGVGAARVYIGASSLLQRQPAHVAVAAIGHKDVIVHFCH